MTRFLVDTSVTPDIFGKINPPVNIALSGEDAYSTLIRFLNVGMNLILVAAGLFTLFNIIMAGFAYMGSSGDAKKTQEAQSKIMFTVIGLGIIVAAPVIAGVIGLVMFGNWQAVLNPSIKTINDIKP